ncbi:MAG: hypothetical protein LBT51_06565 [Fusobacteriaceae bacterium]|jgi:cellulose biosynthesis protein BcsQ|nr:hypothetical protein [Fusobacteriaceae bacterium]
MKTNIKEKTDKEEIYKKTIILSGNAGSGKTEFSIQYAMKLAKEDYKVNIVDLDVINVYYRSRENINNLKKYGINVWGSTNFDFNGSDLPAVSYGFESLLYRNEGVDKQYVIIDLAGTRNGLKLLMALKNKDFQYELWMVINIFRAETSSVEDIINLIEEYEEFSGFKVTGLVNNSNLLKETIADDVRQGESILYEVSKKLSIPVICTMVLKSVNFSGSNIDTIVIDEIQNKQD